MNLDKLRKIRKECGYTQQDLADHFGYSRQCFQMKEVGRCGFKLSEIRELKGLLGLTKEECFDIFIGE